MKLFDKSDWVPQCACTECLEYVDQVPTIEMDDPNGDPFFICLPCLKKAVELASKAEQTAPRIDS